MVLVTGKFLLTDGTPDAGRVTFSPLVMAVDDTPEVHFTTRQIVSATLDDEGAFELEVTPSDDPGWRLSQETMDAGGMPYRVLVALTTDREVFTVYVPDAVSHDLSDLVDLDAVPEVITIPTPGPENVLSIGDVVTSAPGAAAEVTIEGDSPEQVLNFVLPRGETGPANILTVGDVTTGAPGSAADVDISGTAPSQTIDFTIPRGDKGEPGDPNVLSIGTVATGDPGTDADADISGDTPNQVLNLTIPRGDVGAMGPANVLSIGSVTTGDPGSAADADISGTAPNQSLSLTIPRGDKGETPFVRQTEPPTDLDVIWYDEDDEELPFEFGGASVLDVGTTTGTVAAGDDARFTDARTPTAHKTSHATGGSDALAPADIGAGSLVRARRALGATGATLWAGIYMGHTTTSPLPNRQMAVPVHVPRAVIITEMVVSVTGAAVDVTPRFALYSMPEPPETGSWVGNLLLDAGTVDATTLGTKTITLPSPVTLQPGWYTLMCAMSNGTTSPILSAPMFAYPELHYASVSVVSNQMRYNNNYQSAALTSGGDAAVTLGFPATFAVPEPNLGSTTAGGVPTFALFNWSYA